MSNLEKFLGCILAGAVGDALGMPFEKMTAEKIRESLATVGDEEGVRKFYPPTMNPNPFPGNEKLTPGSWTDDTQLTLATMRALTAAGGSFSMEKIAKQHIVAYRTEDRGSWGGSTTKACAALEQGVHWSSTAIPNSGGNGVMMKIAPLGLLASMQAKDEVTFMAECVDFSRMTHLVTPAIVSGCVQAYAVQHLARSKPGRLYKRALLFRLYLLAIRLESRLPRCEEKISSLLALLSHLYENKILFEETPESLGKHFCVGYKIAFSAYFTFGLSYALFFRNPTFSAVFDAVEAGGDTDTTASIVGNLVGALHGASVIPPELLSGLKDIDKLRQATLDFYRSTI